MREVLRDRYAIAVFALALISFVYWSVFAIHAYNTFHEYFDLATFSYNLFLYSHYPQIASGLQMLVYGNHISPDMLFVLVLYSLLPSPLMLLIVQAMALSLAGIALYFIAKDLLKSRMLGLAFALAFLLSPGVHGMLVFDFHVESFISLFYLLTFYYMMKGDKRLFYPCLALLLGTIEVAPVMALTLGIGVGAFELLHDKDMKQRRNRIGLAASSIAISLVVLGLYALLTMHLANAYATAYPNLPSMLQLSHGTQNTLLSSISDASRAISVFATNLSKAYSNVPTIYTIYGLAIIAFGFGIGLFFAPLAAAIMLVPWISGAVFSSQSIEFVLTWYQYFGFAMAPAAAAAIMGSMVAIERKNAQYKLLASTGFQPKSIIAAVVICFAVVLFSASPFFIQSRNIYNLSQAFLFTGNSSINAYDAQLAWVIRQVPQNASVMTQPFIASHLANRRYVELLISNETFAPEYILVDFNMQISLNAYANNQLSVASKVINGNPPYYLYMQNGSAELYKLGAN